MSRQNCPLTESEIDALLIEHWPDISRRAAARAARTVTWNRRLRAVNGVLAVAVLLMGFQAGWSFVVLAELQGAVPGTGELVRTILAAG